MKIFSALREMLRRLGNPYATLEVERIEADAATTSKQSSQRDHAANSGNPYARIFDNDSSYEEREQAHSAVVIAATKAEPSLTQSQFEQRARAIFRPYIPAAERGRLRAHHRDFIARNKSRSAQVRYQLLERLAIYDISSIPGIQPQFNRERDELTIEKLAEIEKLFVGCK